MSTRKSLAWSFSQEGFQKVVRFAGSIIIARILTPDEIGVFSIAMAAGFLLNSLQDLGVGTYLVREPDLTTDKIRTVFGLSLVIQWSLGVVLLILRNPLADLYNQPGISDVLAVIAISFFVGPFGQPASSLLRREMRFAVLHHIAIATVVTGTATSILLAINGYSYMSLAWGLVAGNTVRTLLVLLVHRDHLRMRPGYRHWRDVLQFGGWLTGAGLAGTASAEGTKFVIGGLLSPASLALFERAQQIPRMSREALFMPVGRVILPAFSKDIRKGVSIGPKVEAYVAATTVILWPAYLGLSFISVAVVTFLFGENWRVAGEILPYILAGTAIRAALPQPDEILVPHGKVRRLFVFRSFQVFNTLVFTLAGALHSLELFAVLRIPSSLLYLAANAIAIVPYMQVSPKTLLIKYLNAGGIAILCATPIAVTKLIYWEGVPVLFVLLSIFAGGFMWVTAIFFIRHPLAKEFSDLFRNIVRQRPLKGLIHWRGKREDRR